jgi:hypothetical protein
MGPVDRGERMMARKGARILEMGVDEVSKKKCVLQRTRAHQRQGTYLGQF